MQGTFSNGVLATLTVTPATLESGLVWQRRYNREIFAFHLKLLLHRLIVTFPPLLQSLWLRESDRDMRLKPTRIDTGTTPTSTLPYSREVEAEEMRESTVDVVGASSLALCQNTGSPRIGLYGSVPKAQPVEASGRIRTLTAEPKRTQGDRSSILRFPDRWASREVPWSAVPPPPISATGPHQQWANGVKAHGQHTEDSVRGRQQAAAERSPSTPELPETVDLPKTESQTTTP